MPVIQATIDYQFTKLSEQGVQKIIIQSNG